MPPEPISREIPGYFFCPEKKKYFKIETSHTAPVDAPYSAANVKKRRLQQEQAERSRKRRDAFKGHIKRAHISRAPMTGGRLMQQLGVHDPELPNKCWLTGLQDKGEVLVCSSPGTGPIQSMLVNGDDTQSGMAVVYAAPTPNGVDHRIHGCYIPTDQDGFVNFCADPLSRRSRQHTIRQEPFHFVDITSIAYHRASHQILQTSTTPTQGRVRITMFEPRLSAIANSTSAHDFTNEPGPHPAWLLGEASVMRSIILPPLNVYPRTSRVQPDAHGESTLKALVATDRGLLKIVDSAIEWMGGHNPGPHHKDTEFPSDCLAVDWHPTNPNIIYAGDRNGKFFHHDMRGPSRGTGWDWYRHRSSVAHVRGIDDFQILAAGPKSAMAIYDVRRLDAGHRRLAAPVCTMHEYVNRAHIGLGLDTAKLHGGESVVAAATSSGTVQVFSLRTGHRLRAGALDRLANRGSVVKCLQWETMPGEKDPSLWVGVNSSVKKYSFGLEEGEDDW